MNAILILLNFKCNGKYGKKKRYRQYDGIVGIFHFWSNFFIKNTK